MSKNLLLYVISGIIGLIALYAGFTGKKLMFISGPRSAVIVLTIVGIVMCSSSTMGTFITKAPAHPFTIAGYLLGLLALFIGFVQIFKFKVPFFNNPNNALQLIVVIIIIKFIIARFSFLVPLK